MYRRPESVLVLIYTRQSEVLLLQRVDAPEFWQSVTGGLEIDEHPGVAAMRELFEETGIRATLARLNGKQKSNAADQDGITLVDHQCSSLFEISGVWRKRYHPDHTHNREHLFSVQLSEQVPINLNSREHHRCIWLDSEQAIERATSATNKQAIVDIVPSAACRY